MKRLLYIPMDYRLQPNKAWYDAFCKHFEAKYYTTIGEAVAFRPHYIFMQSGAIMGEEIHLMKALGTTIIQWTGDARHELLPEVLNTPADITFLASGIAQKEMYEKALGHKVYYLQHAASEFRGVNKEAKGIVFVGNNYSEFPGAVERSELCKILSQEFEDFNVYGSGFSSPEYRNPGTIPYEQVADLYNNSFISISASIFNDMEGYWSNRPLDIMAAGSYSLMRYSPNLEKYFRNGVDCIFYHTAQDAIYAINFLKSNRIFRDYITEHGQKTIQRLHTYDIRVSQIIEVLNEQ